MGPIMDKDQKEPPQFVDMFGTGERLGQHPGGPPDQEDEHFIPKCWGGREQLWKVFWAYGFFGVGLVTAISFAVVIFSLLLGLIASPADLKGGAAGMAFAAAASAFLILPYLVWIHVSVWRSAPNCEDRRWTTRARFFIVIQAALILYAMTEAGLFLAAHWAP